MSEYEKMGDLGEYARLNDKKNEFVKISLEISDIEKQIRDLNGQLKSKKEYAAILINNMVDICGRTGLTICAERSDDNGLQ